MERAGTSQNEPRLYEKVAADSGQRLRMTGVITSKIFWASVYRPPPEEVGMPVWGVPPPAPDSQVWESRSFDDTGKHWAAVLSGCL